MHERAATLIDVLGLQPHPEGGYYKEVYRSTNNVAPGDGRDERPALTSIYFLLVEGSHSKWHVVASDEVWHHIEGDALELLTVDPSSLQLNTLTLDSPTEGGSPIQVVPATYWQAARTRGDYTLVGCTVGPGFVFEDFRLLRDDEQAAGRIRNELGAFAHLL